MIFSLKKHEIYFVLNFNVFPKSLFITAFFVWALLILFLRNRNYSLIAKCNPLITWCKKNEAETFNFFFCAVTYSSQALAILNCFKSFKSFNGM